MKKSISDLRKIASVELAKRKSAEPTEKDIKDATRILNSIYKFTAFYIRVFNFENDGNLYDLETANSLDARCEKWIDRINNNLNSYGLKMDLPGLYPVLTDKNGSAHMNLLHFYC